MQTRLLFVRHGDSYHKQDGVLAGPAGCRGLTPDGQAQAASLAHQIGATVSDPVAVYSSVIRRAVETAAPIADILGVEPVQDCGLCTWHMPPRADGMTFRDYQVADGLSGGGIFRPWERDNESWAEMVTRTGRAILDIADRHRFQTVILVGHAETVNISFHALGMLPLYRSFDTIVSSASVTEWVTDDEPTRWPPARWTLNRFNAELWR